MCNIMLNILNKTIIYLSNNIILCILPSILNDITLKK